MLVLKSKGTPILTTLLATVLVLGLGARGMQPAVEQEIITYRPSDEIKFAFEDIATLSLQEYNYKNVAVYESEKLKFIFNVPFTSKKFMFVYEGSVEAGIKDASQIKYSRYDKDKTFIVQAPSVEVLDSTIDTENVEVYDQSFNPLRQISVEDVTKALSGEASKAAQEAINDGILVKAQRQLDRQIEMYVESVIENSDFEGYDVQIRHI